MTPACAVGRDHRRRQLARPATPQKRRSKRAPPPTQISGRGGPRRRGRDGLASSASVGTPEPPTPLGPGGVVGWDLRGQQVGGRSPGTPAGWAPGPRPVRWPPPPRRRHAIRRASPQVRLSSTTGANIARLAVGLVQHAAVRRRAGAAPTGCRWRSPGSASATPTPRRPRRACSPRPGPVVVSATPSRPVARA